MSPPIREGSGDSIGSIRLGDGSEIAEVRTGAGDVLFSSLRVLIDSYEDGNLSEYNTNAAIGSTAFDGTNSLRLNNDTETFAYSGSGLGRYPQRGDTWEFYYRFTGNTFANFSCQWALQSVLSGKTQASDTYSGYGVQWSSSGATQVEIYEDGTSQDSGSISVSTGNWYRNEVRFNNPVIEYEVFDPNGNSLLSLSFSSTTHDSGAFGFSSFQNSGADRFIDFIRVIA